MANYEDLATLWSFVSGLRCVLTPVDAGWQIRIEDGREVVKSYVANTSDEALMVADEWLRACDGGRLPAA